MVTSQGSLAIILVYVLSHFLHSLVSQLIVLRLKTCDCDEIFQKGASTLPGGLH